jgi:hypothetical protein
MKVVQVGQCPRALDESRNGITSAVSSDPRQCAYVFGHLKVDIDTKKLRDRMRIGALTDAGQELLGKATVLLGAHVNSSVALPATDSENSSAHGISTRHVMVRNARC